MTKYLFGISAVVNIFVFVFASNSTSTKSDGFDENQFSDSKKSNNESLQLSESRHTSNAVNPHHRNGVVFLSRFNKLMNPRFVHNDNYEHNKVEKRSSFSPLIERNDLPVYRDAPVYSSIITPEHTYPVYPNTVKHVNHIATEHHPHHDYFDYGYIPGIPGKPWTDYPLFTYIPYTRFSCKHVAFAGYYADVETGCQVWHYCQLDGRHDKFLCPNGTIFNQETRVCDWWYNVHCPSSPFKFDVNADLYGFRRNYIQIAAPFKSDHYGDSIAKEIPAPPPPPPIAPGIEYIIPPPALAKGQLLSDRFGRASANRVRVHQSGHYYSPNVSYRRAPQRDVIFAESRRVQHSTKTKTNSNRFSFSRINASGKRRKVKKFIEPAATH